MVLPDLNSTPPEDDVHAPGGEEDVHASGGEEDIHIQIYLALIRTGIEGIEGMVQGGSSIACESRGRHAMPVL